MLFFALLACRPPEAPDNFEDMMGYGLVHFADEDDDALQALADKLIPWVESNLETTEEGYEIAPLSEAELTEAGIDASAEEAILGVAVSVSLGVSLDDVTAGLTYPNLDEIFSNYVSFTRTPLDDRDCFLGGDCTAHSVTDDLHSSVGLGIEFESTYGVDFRRVPLDDGGALLLRRQVGTDPVDFNVDFLAVYQQYGLDICYEAGDGSTRRVQALWADGEVLNADTAEGLYLNLSINTLKKGNADLETWLLEN